MILFMRNSSYYNVLRINFITEFYNLSIRKRTLRSITDIHVIYTPIYNVKNEALFLCRLLKKPHDLRIVRLFYVR